MKKLITLLCLCYSVLGIASPGNQFEKTGTGKRFTPIPVNGLTATLVNDVVEIKWQADTQNKCKQFEIQRSINGESFKTICLIFTINEFENQNPELYFFKDNLKGVSEKKASYRIKQIQTNNQCFYSEVVTTDL